ncbi:protein FAF1 [Podospora aff. communis PSN243]|uniref:Protein FAF1 n=1 Tax=Podospora aff. communis PSN243 TaxID=3040156 RepID=A0AAV9H619_9PEZI|nr:protein FAF1 [Podospora aff. communis PSN243]
MPAALGKRKRGASKEEGEDGDDKAQLQALLQRHFEARFKPLDATFAQPAAREDDDDEDEDDERLTDHSESEWDGISEDEDSDTPKVEVIDYTTSSKTDITATMSKKELKAYLSSKPPSTNTSTTSQPPKKPTASSDPEDSAAFLANDLALQRLIAESHILSAAGGNPSHYLSTAAASTPTNTRAFAEGRTRLKTTDMRVQALGAKSSILSQAKMPMNMRKGILKSATDKEDKRRREARENGIILERVAKGKGRVHKKMTTRRERAVDMPSVGKMRGAELKISAREIRAIEAEGKRKEKGARRRRR